MRNQMTTGAPPSAKTPAEISVLLTELDDSQKKVKAVATFSEAAGLTEFADLANAKLARINRGREIVLARLTLYAQARREAVIAQLPIGDAA